MIVTVTNTAQARVVRYDTPAERDEAVRRCFRDLPEARLTMDLSPLPGAAGYIGVEIESASKAVGTSLNNGVLSL